MVRVLNTGINSGTIAWARAEADVINSYCTLVFGSEEWRKLFNGGFYANRQLTLHLFPYKMLFSSWSCFTKKFRVAFTNFKWMSTFSLTQVVYSLCYQRRNTMYKRVKIQGGSNMTGTDLCVNKPHCAATVRPWESEATTSTLPPARVRTCSVLSGSC